MENEKIIVIGGGHAGCEAALASSRMGIKTILITSNISSIAYTPCNPSIGGPAKGIVVREIDALGGEMAKNTDKSSLQIKMLNRSKGPAVHSLRAQVDKVTYPKNMQEIIKSQDNLTVIENMVEEIIFSIDKKEVLGVILEDNTKIMAEKIILTTGTYMDSYIINGSNKVSSGPNNYQTTKNLSNSLKDAGLELFRLKTGTPARILTSSIDFSKAEITSGDQEQLAFSFYQPKYLENTKQLDCHLIYTQPETHKIIIDNIKKSAMYSGVIKGVGPRYCPSIEDKLVRFADKKRHQLFLEPESRELNTTYVQGFSTSMPYDIQDKMIKTLPGLENAIIDKYGYAIEYDAIKPEQLKLTLECKKIKNLYSAGQINGTSGYEEAAGQGIVAGINAVLSIKGKKPMILSRMNSYIGLMIDDLITKGTNEPYRLLTSRSEYRLFLRSDNADLRLSKIGYQVGLLKQNDYDKFLEKEAVIKEANEKLEKTVIGTKLLTEELAIKYNTMPLKHGVHADVLLKRPDINYKKIKELLNLNYSDEVLEQVEIQIKYSGYIKKLEKQISRAHKLYNIKIPIDLDYNNIDNIALEAREKLNNIKPETLGHAGQISGINPSDIAVLQIFLEHKRRNNEK